RRARVHRLGHPPVLDPPPGPQGPPHPADQARNPPAQEAWEHPAMTHIVIVRGNPNPEEIAALVAVLSAAASRRAAPPPPPMPSAWRDRAALTRRAVRPGPGAWRASALPR